MMATSRLVVGLAVVLDVVPLCGAVRGVLMRESLVPPFKHSNAYGARVASAHWEQSDARVLESFIRLTGSGEVDGRLWSMEALGASSLSLELTLRHAGEGPATSDPATAAGLGLWSRRLWRERDRGLD